MRGNALTHDLQLGADTLKKLKTLGKGSRAEVKVPRYNKSANSGKGDRADPDTWPTVKAPVDVVLFEGWMLGFSPVSEEAAREVRRSNILPSCQAVWRGPSQLGSHLKAC